LAETSPVKCRLCLHCRGPHAPEALDAAIIFAPVGALVPAALAAVKKGGRLVCGGFLWNFDEFD
jgi:hypothetical protein